MDATNTYETVTIPGFTSCIERGTANNFESLRPPLKEFGTTTAQHTGNTAAPELVFSLDTATTTATEVSSDNKPAIEPAVAELATAGLTTNVQQKRRRLRGRRIAALATIGAIAAPLAAPATANGHLGNLGIQFVLTQKHARENCGKGWQWLCRDAAPGVPQAKKIKECRFGKTKDEVPCLVSIRTNGPHSREFIWKYQKNFIAPVGLWECTDVMRINHSNRIFFEDINCRNRGGIGQ